MIVSLEEAKNYLRIDTDNDNAMIESLLQAAENLCADVARKSVADFETLGETGKIATLYALAYFYENRANADHKKLTLTLRALLFAAREDGFFEGRQATNNQKPTTSTDISSLTFAMFDCDGNLVDSGLKIASDEEIGKILDETGFKK